MVALAMVRPVTAASSASSVAARTTRQTSAPSCHHGRPLSERLLPPRPPTRRATDRRSTVPRALTLDAEQDRCHCAAESWGRATIQPFMPLQVLQRLDWYGTPIELGEQFVLHKNRRTARASIFTHQLRWEVRLLVGSQLDVVLMSSKPLAEFEIVKSIDWSRFEPEPDGRRHVDVSTTGVAAMGYATHHVGIRATRDADGTVRATHSVACGVSVERIADSSTCSFVDCLRCNPSGVRLKEVVVSRAWMPRDFS